MDEEYAECLSMDVMLCPQICCDHLQSLLERNLGKEDSRDVGVAMHL